MMFHERLFIIYSVSVRQIPGEIFVVDVVGDLHSGHVNLGGGGNQEPLVDPRNRMTQLWQWREGNVAKFYTAILSV